MSSAFEQLGIDAATEEAVERDFVRWKSQGDGFYETENQTKTKENE